MGINVIKDEHVMIDILYDGVKPARKRWLAIVNYLIVLARGAGVYLSGLQVCGVAVSRSVRAWRSHACICTMHAGVRLI